MRGRLGRSILAVLAGLGALLAIVTITPLVPWTASQLTVNWTDSDGEVLVMLAGGMIENPALPGGRIFNESTYWRSLYALEAWRRGHFRKLFLVGHGSDTVKPLLVAYGVPADAIVVENASATTRENALYAKPLLARQAGRIVLLTSDYHMFRAWRCFQKLGVPVISRPFPDLLKRSNQLPKRWEGFLILSGELASIGYYRIRGWI